MSEPRFSRCLLVFCAIGLAGFATVLLLQTDDALGPSSAAASSVLLVSHADTGPEGEPNLRAAAAAGGAAPSVLPKPVQWGISVPEWPSQTPAPQPSAYPSSTATASVPVEPHDPTPAPSVSPVYSARPWVLKSEKLIEERVGRKDKKPGRYEDSRCDFTGCPEEGPFLYYITPHRNRAMVYRRLLLTAQYDIRVDGPLPQACVCAVAADYDDVIVGPPVEYALDVWESSVHHVRVNTPRDGGFDLAFARQVAVDVAVHTPRDKSIVFFVDTDMIVLPGFMRDILRYTWLGHSWYAPQVLSMDISGFVDAVEYKPTWKSCVKSIRFGGYGIYGVYAADVDQVDGLPLRGAHIWGGEDGLSSKRLNSILREVRWANPFLWHIDHPHQKSWTHSVDGVGGERPKNEGPNGELMAEDVPWFERMPPGYFDHALEWVKKCEEGVWGKKAYMRPWLEPGQHMDWIRASPNYQIFSRDVDQLFNRPPLPTPSPSPSAAAASA